MNRKDVLLNAAYDLLKKQERSHFVLNLLEQTAYWDGAICDGYCLMKDIETELEGKFTDSKTSGQSHE